MYMRETIMKRYVDNPIITPQMVDDAYATFNCGQTMYKGKTILLVAVSMRTSPVPRIHVAESDDGINFSIRKEPFIMRSKIPYITELDEWPIDPRVTYIPEDDTYIGLATGKLSEVINLCKEEKLREYSELHHGAEF